MYKGHDPANGVDLQRLVPGYAYSCDAIYRSIALYDTICRILLSLDAAITDKSEHIKAYTDVLKSRIALQNERLDLPVRL